MRRVTWVENELAIYVYAKSGPVFITPNMVESNKGRCIAYAIKMVAADQWLVTKTGERDSAEYVRTRAQAMSRLEHLVRGGGENGTEIGEDVEVGPVS